MTPTSMELVSEAARPPSTKPSWTISISFKDEYQHWQLQTTGTWHKLTQFATG